jgi:hypothetical protein
MIANDVVRDLKRSGGTCRIFKLDFHKAFDTVSWDYFNEVMGYMGFGAKWRR